MLPWKRSKVKLAEEDPAPKGKSAAVSCRALFSSLMPSCPAILPSGPIEKLGRVFKTKRQKVELNKEDPTYSACYLGSVITLQAKGVGCTQEPVDKIWAKSDFGCGGTRMRLTLGSYGIRMTPSENGTGSSHAYQLHRITYCTPDTRHPKVFAWIYRHQSRNKTVVLRCHAVLVSRADKAHAMARFLGEAALAAFSDFKKLKRQSESRRAQEQLLGNTVLALRPLRKPQNTKSSYLPTAERSKSMPRLTAILEEEEEDGKNTGGNQQGMPTSMRTSAHVRCTPQLAVPSRTCRVHRR